MNAVRTKVLQLFFPPVCPFAPSIFFTISVIWVSLEKIWMGQMGRLEEKIEAVLLY
jgi:hypothetical protein